MIHGGAITVRGHSDSRGSDSDNLRVSEARTKAVADYLVTKGIAADRMTELGVGETRPIAPNAHLDGSDDEQGRAKNRRVDVQGAPEQPPEPEKTEPRLSCVTPLTGAQTGCYAVWGTRTAQPA